jgi:hypothetical protein
MQQEQDLALQKLARYAAHSSIKGSSFNRNALLKPLDIILRELDSCTHPDDMKEIAYIRAGTKEFIFAHLARIAGDGHKPGKTKQSKVNQFVDLFFDEVLNGEYQGKINKLLAREKLVRAAYLFWVREAWGEIFVARGKAKDAASATDAIEQQGDEIDDEEA